MNAKHVELWQRIESFQIDSPEATLPFSARLAGENNWTRDYALRVIAEYKRFAFLAVAAGHPVSPSEEVDQAWHLHLTYSENYWKVFCPEILGKPFHHQPTQGGPGERDKFGDWYARTFKSYKKLFGEDPPADIWPAPEMLRTERHDFIRVDRQTNWIIPKPRLRKHAERPSLDGRELSQTWQTALLAASESGAPFVALAAVLVFCTAATLATNPNVFDWRGPDFLVFYALFLGACFALALWLRRKLRLPAAPERLDVPDLDGYATAFLNGGKRLAVNTAIANLARQKALRLDPRRKRLTSLVPKPEFAHPLEHVVYAAADSTDGVAIARVRSCAEPILTRVADTLKSQGLVVPDRESSRAILFPMTLALAAIGVGIIKIVIGVSRDKPVGFLVALCSVSLVFALLAFGRRPVRSRQGDAVLKNLRQHHIGSEHLGSRAGEMPSNEFAALVGLFGMTALVGPEWNDFRRSLQPASNFDGSVGSSCGSSSGSSCGGGGCGGGCGGCGGG